MASSCLLLLQAIANQLNEEQVNYTADVARQAFLFHAMKKAEHDRRHAAQLQGGQLTLNSFLRGRQQPPDYPGIAAMASFAGPTMTWDPDKFAFKVGNTAGVQLHGSMGAGPHG